MTIKVRYEKIILCGEVKIPPGVYIIGRVRHAAVEWQFSCYLKYWARAFLRFRLIGFVTFKFLDR